jgi:hypothetical protein
MLASAVFFIAALNSFEALIEAGDDIHSFGSSILLVLVQS